MQCSGIVAAEGVRDLFSIGQIVSRDDKRRSPPSQASAEHCCEDRDANARGMNPSKSSMYKYRQEEVPEMFYSTQPTFSTNLFDQPSRPTFSTNLLDQSSRPTFSTSLLDQQNAFHSRDCRCPFSLDDDERHPCVLRSWPVRHQHLREIVLPL